MKRDNQASPILVGYLIFAVLLAIAAIFLMAPRADAHDSGLSLIGWRGCFFVL